MLKVDFSSKSHETDYLRITKQTIKFKLYVLNNLKLLVYFLGKFEVMGSLDYFK